MTLRLHHCGGMVLAAATVLAGWHAWAEVALDTHDDHVAVTIDGQPFTSYVFQGRLKPVLFPLLGPGGVPLTRSYPFVEDVPGEPLDHPHHESVWFTHGRINGEDFWSPNSQNQGASAGKTNQAHVEHVEFLDVTGGGQGLLESRNRWVSEAGETVCTDTRRLVFAADQSARTIDYAVTFHADHGPITFGDTKEGTMALRVIPALQPKDTNGSQGAAGRITDAEGRVDADVWGKKARWVDYSGAVGDRTLGIAMCDAPTNPRHPTTWHARDYGLFAANPFGLHDFSGAAEHAGDLTVPAGESLTLRYLIVLHDGDATAADIEGRFRRWAETVGSESEAR